MRRFPMLLAPLALLFALTLAACGNKGPLVRAVDDGQDIEDVGEAEDAEDLDVEDAGQAPAADDPVDAPAEDAEQTDAPPPADPDHG